MKRCKTCRFYFDYGIKPFCGNHDLEQESDQWNYFELPSEDFGCTEHEPREEDA